MYATPILYPLNFTQGTLRNVIAFNPLTSLFESFRYALFSTGAMDWLGMLYTGAFTLVAIVLGILVFNRVERTFMDTV
jgi:lipopolysaccharide transport system permease protein